MIKGVFPRLFGNFREGAILHSKFVTSGTTTTVTFALKSTTAGANYNLTLARTGVGLYSLTLTGGARNLALVGVVVGVAAGRRGLRFEPAVAAFITESTGVITLQSIDYTVGALADSITAGDEVHVVVYVDK